MGRGGRAHIVSLRMRIEDVIRFPLPGLSLPGSLRFAPGDRALVWLASPEAGLRQALFAMDLATGATRVALDPRQAAADETKLSLEEQLRRERLRERSVGVTSYQFAEKGTRILVPLGGALLVKDDLDAPAREIVAAGGPPVQEARLSPDGEWVGFVRDAELHVVSAAGGTPSQVTSGARGTGRTNGLADYIAMEEMHRYQGWWWSDDSSRIAFEECDETHIPVYRIVHQGKDATGDAAQEDHRYPFAGQANAKVRLGVVARTGGPVTWMDLRGAEYLARVRWMPDGSLLAQVQDRRQRRLDVLRLDPATGRSTVLHTESSDTWVNLHDMLRPVDGPGVPRGSFLWASERTGFQHLEIRGPDGALVRTLTSGEWQVDSVVAGGSAADGGRGVLWCLGTAPGAGAVERHLYEVPFDGSGARRITTEPGLHSAVIDHSRARWLHVRHSLSSPPVILLRELAGGRVLRAVHDARDPRIDELNLAPPELSECRADDGTTLRLLVYRPDASHGAGPFPTVVSVYGGPHVQRVQDSWEATVNMRAQYLRAQGFLVVVCDNRGSMRRGKAFEEAIHRNMGDLEVRDQAAAVRAMAERGLADPARVGIYGWSYGGYMASMALCRAPDVFRAACAGAPVTHWDGYDTHYTERYMDLPQENPEGYRVSSVMHHVPHMRGKLLLVHGMLDENVHFRHTARLVNALNRHRKDYELLMYPDERHMPRHEGDRRSMEERIVAFFRRELAG
ncbi:MAG: Dipeptidyl aminopeptidase 4 [Planctomycetes bacterium]|nr:Dipeptidyl aminopeptidase 4 [Planctomycetota bacterium]